MEPPEPALGAARPLGAPAPPPAADEARGEAAHTRPEEGGDAPESVVRITAAGKERHYISYATGLLLDRGERLTAGLSAASARAWTRLRVHRCVRAAGSHTGRASGAAGHSTVVLTAMGSVINKCITVAEILKRRVAGLHQWNQIKSIVLEVLDAPGCWRLLMLAGRPSCAAFPRGQPG